MNHLGRSATLGWFMACLLALPPALAGDLDPVSPSAFFPAGLLGVQVGSPWRTMKHSLVLGGLTCQRRIGKVEVFDEVCFFKIAGRVAGAPIHDGFVVRKGNRVVLIGTGISIKNEDDPLAETVVRVLEAQIQAKFQQTGSEVLFVNPPTRPLSAGELEGFAQRAPALLVELDPGRDELEVLYGYLAPVEAFSAMASD